MDGFRFELRFEWPDLAGVWEFAFLAIEKAHKIAARTLRTAWCSQDREAPEVIQRMLGFQMGILKTCLIQASRGLRRYKAMDDASQ